MPSPERSTRSLDDGRTATRVGVQLQPQHCGINELRAAWRQADEASLDSIWVWDHFFPFSGDPAGSTFESWTLLAAMAVDTNHASIGVLVTGIAYRNPNLLADMARTCDHLSGGRVYLGVGAGWFERDYVEYGYEFGTARTRAAQLEQSLTAIRRRLDVLRPPPVSHLPLLIGGAGRRFTLPLVARFADAWNTAGSVPDFAERSHVLDQHCLKFDRSPQDIERSVILVTDAEIADASQYVDAGATHLIVSVPPPFDLDRAMTLRDAIRARVAQAGPSPTPLGDRPRV